MHLFFLKEETEKAKAQMSMPESNEPRPLRQTVLYFAAMVAVLVFANWGRPDAASGFWHMIYSAKWILTAVSAGTFGAILILWYNVKWWQIVLTAVSTGLLAVLFPREPLVPFSLGVVGLSIITARGSGENREWFEQTWGFAKQILPLLLYGVLIAGFLLGRPGHEGVVPSAWVSQSVGGNSLGANLFASVAGAFMYFATLTEVPILQGLIGSGMGKGPALALLLAGPALSLPNMLVIRSVMGTKKTTVFVLLVIVMATVSGLIYGSLA
jgi:uncharacterized membrane protein YraQ (UPF0718 family)